jgi:hypothetical protein
MGHFRLLPHRNIVGRFTSINRQLWACSGMPLLRPRGNKSERGGRFMMLPSLPNDARDGESLIRLPRCLGSGQNQTSEPKANAQKASAQTASLEQRS